MRRVRGKKLLATVLAALMMIPSTMVQMPSVYAKADEDTITNEEIMEEEYCEEEEAVIAEDACEEETTEKKVEDVSDNEATEEDESVPEVINEDILLEAPDGATATSESSFEWDGTTITKFIGSETQIVIPAKAKKINTQAFDGKNGITSVDFSLSGVTSIGTLAFNGCTSLQTVTLSSGLAAIGSKAFYECSALTSITIPSTVTSIGANAFEHCSNLSSVAIKTKAFTAGESIFAHCPNLSTVSLPSGMVGIPENLFRNASITSITIPSTVTSIGNYAFQGSGLTSITIPRGVTSIGKYAFYKCGSLTDITILSNISSIKDYTFASCSSLQSITIPASVTMIGERAFAGCTTLTEVEVPAAVERINAFAFEYCTGLTSVKIYGNTIDCGTTPFYGITNLKIYGYENSNVSAWATLWGIDFVVLPKDVTFTVVFNGNGATSGSMNNLQIINSGRLTSNAFVRKGYEFTGWNTRADGMGNPYADNATVTKLVADGESITLYAQWKIETYTITYNLNGGTNHSSNPSTYNIETETITLGDPTRTGYSFVGWYTNSSCTNQIAQIAKGSTGNKTLYAKWTKTYTITYNLNGGTNHSSNPSTYNIETETITLGDPTRTGYTFGGWYTDSSFTSSKVTQIAKGSTGNKTFYAKWTPRTYTISYNLNGGTNSSSNPSTYNIETETIVLSNPTRTGYTFGGWYTDSSFTSSKVTQIAKGSTGNKTFYAKWTPRTYTISYNLNGGTNSSSNPSTYNIETETIVLSNPTRTGYTFGGWYTDSSFTSSKVTQIAKGSTGNKTFYAKWIDASAPSVAVPTGLTVKSAAYNKLTLSWKAATDVTGYEIYRSTSKNDGYSKIATISKASTVTYTNSGVNTGTTYYYKLRAYKVVNNNTYYSDMTAPVSGKTALGKSTISSISTVSDSSVKVTWKKVSGASGYELYRSTSKSGTYSKVATIKSGSTVSYTNSKLTSGKTYYYKVRAYRTVNSKNVYGSYSAVVFGKTYTNTEAFVARIYTMALNRSPEAGGLAYWTGEINAKRKTPVEVAEFFIFSQEFTNKKLNDTEYIKVLYRTFMGREYDQAGLNYWISQLNKGKTRKQVLESFASCPEFQKIIKSFGL